MKELGASDRGRTYNLHLRRAMLYPVELQMHGGAERDRTAYLLNAIQTRYQLRYSPNAKTCNLIVFSLTLVLLYTKNYGKKHMTAIQNKFLQILLIICTINFIFNNDIAIADSKGAEEFISNTSNRVLKVIESNISIEKKSKQLEKIFADIVDINWMGKFAIAKFWKTMSDKEKEEYLIAYKKYLIKTYVPRFQEYNNQVVNIISVKDIGHEQYQIVTQIITSKNNEKTTLNISYRCKEDNGQFKIRDIIGEDFSLLATQRSEFAAIMERGGIERLIKILISK